MDSFLSAIFIKFQIRLNSVNNDVKLQEKKYITYILLVRRFDYRWRSTFASIKGSLLESSLSRSIKSLCKLYFKNGSQFCF